MTEPASPVELPVAERLAKGREALARHAWTEAYDLLATFDESDLTGADLEALSEASFFAAHTDRAVEFMEAAFKAHVAAGESLRAAFVAFTVARQLRYSGRASMASAWSRRGARLLEDQPESYAHAYLALDQSEIATAAGDVETALKLAEEAVQIANRARHPDLQATTLMNLGSLKIAMGSASDGMGLMEEASIAAVNGELSPYVTGVTCCRMIAASRDLNDYSRASEWTQATERYCERQSLSGFPGVCRIHRAEIVAIGGAWERAEAELHRATDELASYNAISPMADGFYAIGEIRRLKGDFAGAEEALRQGHAFGRTPQPALALIRLAEGKDKAAAAAIGSALRDETWDRWARAKLLPAQVEIAVATRDMDVARQAATELDEIVASYSTPALSASRNLAWGRIHLAAGDAAAAVTALRGAIRDWREVGSPYEIARSRMLLARALRALDDDDAATLELEAAIEEFERLGATVDLATARKDERTASDRRQGPTQARKTFMFTDIVGSTNLAELLGNEAWSHLLRWHDDALRGQITKSGGEVVESTGDGFFAAFDTAGQGIECAAAIQQVLAEHRRSSGFAIAVRIGLHTAIANQADANYSGLGVHTAARIAALAGGGEILASGDTLAEAGDTPADAREVTLKGVSAPVTVAAISWK